MLPVQAQGLLIWIPLESCTLGGKHGRREYSQCPSFTKRNKRKSRRPSIHAPMLSKGSSMYKVVLNCMWTGEPSRALDVLCATGASVDTCYSGAKESWASWSWVSKKKGKEMREGRREAERIPSSWFQIHNLHSITDGPPCVLLRWMLNVNMHFLNTC